MTERHTGPGSAGDGARRAQLVLTVANVDTGAVVSAGVAHLYDPEAPDEPVLATWLQLPRQWRPDLPADQRYALEAEAIAAESIDPWRLWLGRTTGPPDSTHPPSPATAIAVALRLGLTVTVGGRPTGVLTQDTVEQAVADLLSSLPDALGDLIPAEPDTPIPVPFERRLPRHGRRHSAADVNELMSISRDWSGILDVDGR